MEGMKKENKTKQNKTFFIEKKIERPNPPVHISDTMSATKELLLDPCELEKLEAMVAHAKQMEEIRSLERKAAIAEMMRPITQEEEQEALLIVERAKENMRLRRQHRKRRFHK